MSVQNPFELAARVAETARSLGIETALIGGYALVLYGHVRQTRDVDFASVVDPYVDLGRLSDALRAQGLKTEVRHPEFEDPLGGALVIWTEENGDGDRIDPVEILNFHNPHRPLRLPAAEIVREAVPLEGLPALRCVKLKHLILLKLYAGNTTDLSDVEELLVQNPGADADEIRQLCERFVPGAIDPIIARATARTQSR